MFKYKSSILLTVAIIGFANTAPAGFSLQPDEHPQQHDQTPVEERLVLQKEQFMKGMPTEIEKVLPYIFDMLSKGEGGYKGLNTTYNVQYVDKIADGNLFDVKPRFDQNQKLHFDFYLQKSLMKNPVYILQVLGVLQTFVKESVQVTSHEKMTSSEYKIIHKDGYWQYDYNHIVQKHYMQEVTHGALQLMGVVGDGGARDSVLLWAERKVNADQGSAYALRETKENQLRAIKNSMMNFDKFTLLKSLTDEEKKQAIEEMAQARKISLTPEATAIDLAIEYFTKDAEAIKAELDAASKKALMQYSKDKKYLDSPEVKGKKDKMEDMALKLDDLVKANDREGVAKLLEAFLPLDIMEPMERGIWKDWIEAVRHPDRENAKLMFRGLDVKNDKPQIAYDSMKKPVGYGYFSTMLSRNQGNYTRRLRSFAGMRYKFMNLNNAPKSPVEVAPSFFGMMTQHSWNPQGSPLLSFSTSPRIAYGFSGRGFLAAKIDPRRVLPNMVSGYEGELELLVPLIIFPDEVVHMEEYPNKRQGSVTLDTILQKVNEKLGHNYELDIEQNSKKMYLGAYKIFANAQGSMGGGQCREIFLK